MLSDASDTDAESLYQTIAFNLLNYPKLVLIVVHARGFQLNDVTADAVMNYESFLNVFIHGANSLLHCYLQSKKRGFQHKSEM